MRSSFVLICVALAIVQSHDMNIPHNLPDCDRRRSRLARSILTEEFYPLVSRLNFTLPDSCPFLPANDMYLDNELVRSVHSLIQLQYPFLNSVFLTE